MINASTPPLVSIALCVYNGDKYLHDQLDSIIAQSYPNLEVIAVDDGSADNSRDILKTYSEKFPWFKVFENEINLGYTKNFEKAIMLCSGEYIALCDQDDIWHPEKIAKQVDAIRDNKLIYHDSAFIDDRGKSMRKNMSDIINLYRGENPDVFLFYNCVSGHSCLFHKDLTKEFLPLPAGHFHDHWIAYVAVNLGKIDFIPESLVSYRQHIKTSTDILNKRKKIKKNYHENRDIKKLRRDLKWIQQCSTFGKNRKPEFLNNLRTLFEARLDAFFSFQYAALIRDHFDVLFYIQKYKRSTKNGYIYRQIWGLKAKLLWARFFSRPDEEEDPVSI